MRRKQELQDESRKRSDKLQEALAVLNNELQKALGKEKDYQKKNIEEIIERSSKKEEWKKPAGGIAGRATHPHLTIYGNLHQV